jgi:hypothetical protein
MSNPQIVTLTFFRFTSAQNKWWGFKQMGLAPLELSKVPGLAFSKMMGSGNGNGGARAMASGNGNCDGGGGGNAGDGCGDDGLPIGFKLL